MWTAAGIACPTFLFVGIGAMQLTKCRKFEFVVARLAFLLAALCLWVPGLVSIGASVLSAGAKVGMSLGATLVVLLVWGTLNYWVTYRQDEDCNEQSFSLFDDIERRFGRKGSQKIIYRRSAPSPAEKRRVAKALANRGHVNKSGPLKRMKPFRLRWLVIATAALLLASGSVYLFGTGKIVLPKAEVPPPKSTFEQLIDTGKQRLEDLLKAKPDGRQQAEDRAKNWIAEAKENVRKQLGNEYVPHLTDRTGISEPTPNIVSSDLWRDVDTIIRRLWEQQAVVDGAPMPLHNLFLTDFKEAFMNAGQSVQLVSGIDGSLTIPFEFRVHFDFQTGSKFVSLYIPPDSKAFEICKALPSLIPGLISKTGIRSGG